MGNHKVVHNFLWAHHTNNPVHISHCHLIHVQEASNVLLQTIWCIYLWSPLVAFSAASLCWIISALHICTHLQFLSNLTLLNCFSSISLNWKNEQNETVKALSTFSVQLAELLWLGFGCVFGVRALLNDRFCATGFFFLNSGLQFRENATTIVLIVFGVYPTYIESSTQAQKFIYILIRACTKIALKKQQLCVHNHTKIMFMLPPGIRKCSLVTYFSYSE